MKEERIKMKEEGNEEYLEFEKLEVWHRRVKIKKFSLVFKL